MKKTESECLDCISLGLHCIGDSCSNRSVTRFYCDKCGNEETLYHYDDMELCKDCLLAKFDVVGGSEFFF